MPAFRLDPRCEVVAVAARTAARAARIADRLTIPAAYGDWRELVASPQVDLVSIAVPPAVQPEIVVAVANARKPVLCEKPLAVDAASAERMLEAVRASGVRHAVDLEFAELPVWRKVKQCIDGGAIGRARSCAVAWVVRSRQRPADSWKERPDAGGGALGGFASHVLYLLEWCLGPAQRAAARLGPDLGRACLEARLDFDVGCRASVSIVTNASHPTGFRAEFSGDLATLVVRNATDDYIRGYKLWIGREGASLEPLSCLELPNVDGDARIAAVAPLVSRFIDAVQGGEAMRPDLADGVRVQRLLDALVAAGRKRGWVGV